MKYAEIVAMSVIHTAREYGHLDDGAMTTLESLAETEKELFLAIMRHLRNEAKSELTAEEMISLYTFILAKAAEAVSNSLGGKEFEMDTCGMLDGKIPYYVDPALDDFCHKSLFPVQFARGFHEFFNHYGEAMQRDGVEPLLILAESLKWSWRVAVHVCYNILEKSRR